MLLFPGQRRCGHPLKELVNPLVSHPSGVGEPGTPLIAAIVANGLLQLTGKPTSSLPFVRT